MNKKVGVIIIITILLTFLGGCRSYRDVPTPYIEVNKLEDMTMRVIEESVSIK